MWCLLAFVHLLRGHYDADENDLWLAWVLIGSFYAAFNQVILSLRGGCVCVCVCVWSSINSAFLQKKVRSY